MPPATIFTIGHSTREAAEFIALLRAHGVDRLVDVRRFPGSRRYPHFGAEPLAASLGEAGIDYQQLPELGGRRAAAPDSPNSGWRNAGFRGYADYMATAEFAAALDRLVALAAERPTAVMCAEAVPWRCHRRMIADALVAAGHEVRHILSETRADAHALHGMARRTPEGTLVYPAGGAPQIGLFQTKE